MRCYPVKFLKSERSQDELLQPIAFVTYVKDLDAIGLLFLEIPCLLPLPLSSIARETEPFDT